MFFSVLVLIVAAFVAFFLTVCVVLYRRLFVPLRPGFLDDFAYTPWEFQADYEDVELVTPDGLQFGVWFLRQPGSQQAIVVSCGHKQHRQDLLGASTALWRKGFNVFLYAARGTPGADRATVTMGVREVNELQTTIAYAQKRIKGARIGLLGYSMGAVTSMLAAAGEPAVEAMVLDSPFSDVRTLLEENVRRHALLPGGPVVRLAALWLRLRSGARLWDSLPLSVLSALEPRPLFFIHGGADAVTSVQHSRRLYDAYRGPREIWIVQGAQHVGAYFADRNLYMERIAGFFARHLGLQRAGVLRLVDEEETAG
ncbi:MAG TPA: alpha/beta hydrolase [Candidatus Dormibacteraeota bacterium]